MGATLSNLNFEHKITKKDFLQVRKFKDLRFGEVSEMKNKKTGKTVLMKEKEIKTDEKYQDLLNKFINRISLSHSNLISIYGIAGMDATDIFTWPSNNKVYVYFEYLQNDLFQALTNRRKPFTTSSTRAGCMQIKSKPQPFEECELYGLMIQLIDVLEYLQRHGVHHGDIRPENCFISDEGIIKLADPWCVYDEASVYDMIKEGNTRIFLSPKALKEFGCRKEDNLYKDDVFGLGMTLLECATLKNSDELYDWKEMKFDIGLFRERLMEVKERYSNGLFEMLLEILCFEEGNRPDFKELKLYLNGEKKVEGKMDIEKVFQTTTVEESLPTTDFMATIQPKTMTSLPKNSLNHLQAQNSFGHKPLPLPKNTKLSLKVIPKDEEVQDRREGIENISPKSGLDLDSSSLFNKKRIDARKEQISQKFFKGTTKKPLESRIQETIAKQQANIGLNGGPNIKEFAESKNPPFQARKDNNPLVYQSQEGFGLPKVNELAKSTANLLSRLEVVSSKADSLRLSVEPFSRTDSMLFNKKPIDSITAENPIMRNSQIQAPQSRLLGGFQGKPRAAVRYANPLDLNDMTSSGYFPNPSYSRTPAPETETLIYSSGYSNPFLSSQTPQGRMTSIASSFVGSTGNFVGSLENISHDSSHNKLEPSKSMLNLGPNMNKEDLGEKNKQLVDHILQKILGNTGLGSTATPSLGDSKTLTRVSTVSGNLQPESPSNSRNSFLFRHSLSRNLSERELSGIQFGNSQYQDKSLAKSQFGEGEKLFHLESKKEKDLRMSEDDHNRVRERSRGLGLQNKLRESLYAQKEVVGRFKINTRRANSTLYGEGSYSHNANNRDSWHDSDAQRLDSGRHTHKISASFFKNGEELERRVQQFA